MLLVVVQWAAQGAQQSKACKHSQLYIKARHLGDCQARQSAVTATEQLENMHNVAVHSTALQSHIPHKRADTLSAMLL